MQSRRILFYYIIMFVLLSVAITGTTLISFKTIENSINRETIVQLKNTAYVAARGFRFLALDPRAIQEFTTESVGSTNLRMTIILPDGAVIGDSHFEKDLMGSHADRPEIRTSINGAEGATIRFSDTLKQYMAYVALPVKGLTGFSATLRIALPVTEMHIAFNTIRKRMGVAGGIMLLLALFGGVLAARRVVLPIYALTAAAKRFAKGDFANPIRVEGPKELETLSRTMSGMARQLMERINLITRQNEELNTVLTGMTEPVLLLDENMNIVKLNRAAESLVSMQEENKDGDGSKKIKIEGKSILEVLRNSGLYDFTRSVLDSGPAENGNIQHETEITLRRYAPYALGGASGPFGPLYLQARASVLRDENDAPQVLLVMNDITRLKHLENIRKDFVVNVSHELKTPITAIQGFVETLESGALKDEEKAGRFLKIIGNHTARLNSIIDDLLTLSRMEQTNAGVIDRTTVSVKDIAENAAAAFMDKAEESGVKLILSVPEGIFVEANQLLLEQALMNLIENALKYGADGKKIIVRAETEAEELRISVTDYGMGIPKGSLPRIFERFYTVNKSRSRELGGTGLGLSIVKHIMNAHGGRVQAESEVGKGSVFTLILPSERSGG